MNFLAAINEANRTNADGIYCKGIIPDIKTQAEANANPDVYIIHASDSLVTAVKAQFGEIMLPYRKVLPPFSSLIWRAKLE